MDVKRIIDLLPHYSEMSDRSDVLSAKINGEWHSIGIETFREKADLISYGLLQLGILPGDRVAIISNNCPEWNFVDFGISQIGAVSVPIYPTMSNADTAFIINDAEVKIACVGDADLYRKIETIRSEIPSLEHVFSFKQAAGQAHLQELIEKGKENQVPQKLNEYKAAIQPAPHFCLFQ